MTGGRRYSPHMATMIILCISMTEQNKLRRFKRATFAGSLICIALAAGLFRVAFVDIDGPSSLFVPFMCIILVFVGTTAASQCLPESLLSTRQRALSVSIIATAFVSPLLILALGAAIISL